MAGCLDPLSALHVLILALTSTNSTSQTRYIIPPVLYCSQAHCQRAGRSMVEEMRGNRLVRETSFSCLDTGGGVPR